MPDRYWQIHTGGGGALSAICTVLAPTQEQACALVEAELVRASIQKVEPLPTWCLVHTAYRIDDTDKCQGRGDSPVACKFMQDS